MKQTLLRVSLSAIFLAATQQIFAQSGCNNQDFEDSTFANWSGATGYNSGGILAPVFWSAGLVSNGQNAALHDALARHTIITSNFIDSLVTVPFTSLPDTLMTSLAPNGGSVSVRLGNAQPGGQAEKLSIPVSVTSTNTFFQFQFASVMEDPGHQWDAQPYFMVNVYDSGGAPVLVLCDTIWAGDTSVPFIVSGNNPNLLYRRWTPLSIDLSSMIGMNATIEFVNADCYYGGHYSYTYIDVSCIGSAIANVWPGDCDYDLQANNIDLLTLGIAFGATGTTRSSASTSWTAQPSADWTQSIPLGANYKHSDTNGDGIVDLNDTLAIALNYSLIHPFRQKPPVVDANLQAAQQFWLQPVLDTVAAGSIAYVDVYVADASNPVNGLYGISFTVDYDNALVQSGTMNASFSGSFAGLKNSSMITMYHDDFSGGKFDIGLSRITHSGVNGYGYLGTIALTTEAVTSMSTLAFSVSNLKSNNAQQVNIPFSQSGCNVVIDPSLHSGTEPDGNSFSISPNPAVSSVTLHSEPNGNIEVTDLFGRIILSTPVLSSVTILNTEEFPTGIYFIQLKSKSGISTKRLVIEK